MKFCPKCGSMMMPEEGFFKCKDCDTVLEIKEEYKSKENKSESEIPVIDQKEDSVLPTIKKECPKCGHNKAGWWMRQTRSADESETRFFRCLECEHTWREYD
ncbi:transcription factor S [archaeon SCG-AAA382B04]|nr:transcription factor S [archaeon SCG-AAA382B04]